MTRTLLLVGTVVAFFISLMAGKVWIGPMDWLADNANGWIMAELRLPRALLGLIVGAALGLSGAVLQGFLRNPLADPTVIGVSSSAALGGVVAIFAGLTGVAMFASAMAGAALSIILLVALAGRMADPLGFILSGMVLSTLSGSMTAFLISVSPNPYTTSEIIAWMMGALTDRSMAEVMRAAPFVVAGMGLLFFTGRALDALTLGEDAARSLGIPLDRLQWQIALGVGLCVGASVAASGIVGFVGLIVPHFIRLVAGARPSAILLPSALGGAILTLVADTVVRLLPGASEVRLGIVMAALGAPFFFILLARSRRARA